MASQAEKRIREKAERLLRQHWPDARIVHEFDLGASRLDLAAITEDRLVMVEIKSENDTLSRLEKQIHDAANIGGIVLICVAEKWVGKLPTMGASAIGMVEDGEGFTCFVGSNHRYPLSVDRLSSRWDRYNSRALLSLLLKPELFALAKPLGAKSRHDVYALQNIAHEHLTGREIRRGVMAALRARRFGWECDAPVEIAA